MDKFILMISICSLCLCFSFASFGEHKNPYPEVVVNREALYNTIKELVGLTPPRSYNNIRSLNTAADFIKNRFKEFGYNPSEQKYTVFREEYKNIIATFGPEDAPRVIIGAHYDVCGEKPGADDNASAVAGLLELARLFKAYKPDINFRIDFVAYTLEEPPFFMSENMGSYVHAKSLHDNNVNVIGMICLEMIGYYSEEPKSQQYPVPVMKLFYPSKGNFIGVVGTFGNGKLIKHVKKYMKKTAIPVESLKAPSILPGVDFSDHRSYWQFGYQAIMITDTAFYRNPNYHEPTDTIDTLNFDKMKEVVKGSYWSILNMDNM